jgi:hypothetical protein
MGMSASKTSHLVVQTCPQTFTKKPCKGIGKADANAELESCGRIGTTIAEMAAQSPGSAANIARLGYRVRKRQR